MIVPYDAETPLEVMHATRKPGDLRLQLPKQPTLLAEQPSSRQGDGRAWRMRCPGRG